MLFLIVNQSANCTAGSARRSEALQPLAGATECSQSDLQRIGSQGRFRSTDFPGSNAGASLKHVVDPTGRTYVKGDFPGSNAGASLKQTRPFRERRRLRRLPRQQCRGLIEAGAAAAGAAQPERPRLPRQQCRGLIEARPARKWRRETRRRLPRQQCRGLIEAAPCRRSA